MVLVRILLVCLLLVSCGGSTSEDPDSPTLPYTTARLSWTPPTENVDGTPLTDLAGYNVYFSTEPGVSIFNHTTTIRIENPDAVEHLVTNLTQGYTYYFVITAFDWAGNESIISNEAEKTIF